MQHSDDPRLLVIALAGLPLTIAILLSYEHQPVTEKHLCSMLSKTDKTIASSLHKLKEFQIITRTTQGWTITTNAQLPLMALQVPVDNLCTKSRKNSDSPHSSSSSSFNKNQEEITLLLPEQESEKFRLLKQACISSGIREPKASVIARLDHVTPEMIIAHCKNALAEGQTIGAAIYRITTNWPVKADRNAAHDSSSYFSGQYARFIVGSPEYEAEHKDDDE